jgi:heterodisulfide reductase subunit C
MNFGYTISADNQIDFDNKNQRLYHTLISEEPSFKTCIQCGTCTATCSAGQFTTLSLRKIHILIARGETANLIEEIARCMLCGKCTLTCPRGVNTRNILMLLKKWSASNYNKY